MRGRFAMRRTTIGLALLAAMLNLYPSTAQTGVGGQRRVALVIGNSAYKYITPALPASANDANDMAAALMRLGFNEIRVLPNLTTDKMSAAVTDFATNVVRKGDLAFFYYSGHGAQVNQENFLLGVDYELQSSDDFVARRAYRMTTVRDALEASGAAVRILVFDACRNSPVLKAGSKRIAPGLAALEGGGEGTLIAFASADNQAALASDKDRNSVFTRELLAALTANTGDVETLFKEVRRNVSAATNGRQTPYLYRFFSSPVYLRGAPATAAVPPDAEAEAWRLTKDSRNRADLEAFLAAFPSGPHRTEARLTLEAVVEAESRSSGKTMLNPVTRAIYVWLPPARFMAVCAPRETDCGDGAAPWHEVEVGKGFWIQKTPVTLSEYRAYAKATKTKFRRDIKAE